MEDLKLIKIDGLYDKAYRAHSNTSFIPEKRAEDCVKSYEAELNEDLQSMPEGERAEYIERYTRHLFAWLSAKSNCLTSVQKDNLVMQLNPSLESGGKQPYQQNRVYDSEGISPALCANKADLMVRLNDRQQKNFVAHDEKTNSLLSTSYKGSQANGMSITNSGYRIRRLTPLECARLQTIPEWYRWECSDTQAYRMLGNGWTNEVIKHIFNYLPKQLTSNEQQRQAQQVRTCTL